MSVGRAMRKAPRWKMRREDCSRNQDEVEPEDGSEAQGEPEGLGMRRSAFGLPAGTLRSCFS